MSGVCECGCGQPTRLAPRSSSSKGWIKGEPLRFAAVGHNARIKPREPLLPRLLSRVDKTETCWLWTGNLNNKGYGQISVAIGDGRSRARLAHRLMYTEMVGPIPDGLELDHLCRVTKCVNPAHLEPVTHAENLRRTRKGVCHNGHPQTEANTIRTKLSRRCRQCHNDYRRGRYRSKGAA